MSFQGKGVHAQMKGKDHESKQPWFSRVEYRKKGLCGSYRELKLRRCDRKWMMVLEKRYQEGKINKIILVCKVKIKIPKPCVYIKGKRITRERGCSNLHFVFEAAGYG